MGQTLNKTFNGNVQQSNEHPLAPFSQFTDLYETFSWDEKLVRKMIFNKVLAPIVKGKETKPDLPMIEECPICFLYNNQMNVTSCCNQAVCTECYLQVKHPSKSTTCPFCNSQQFGARIRIDNPSVIDVLSSPKNTTPRSTTKISTPKSIRQNSGPQSSKPLSNFPAMSSSSDRKQLEASMRKQRADSFGSPHEFLGQSGNTSQDPRRASLSWDDRSGANSWQSSTRDHRSGRRRPGSADGGRRFSAPTGLRQMEDLMLSEAIRASLLAAESTPPPSTTVPSSSPSSLSLSSSPPPPFALNDEARESAASLEDDEDELLSLAIAMSLQVPSTPNNTTTSDPVSEVDINPDETLPSVFGHVEDLEHTNGSGGGADVPTITQPHMILNKLREHGFAEDVALSMVENYEPQLIELLNMGFDNMTLNVGMLERYQGRLLRVVNALSDREGSSPSPVGSPSSITPVHYPSSPPSAPMKNEDSEESLERPDEIDNGDIESRVIDIESINLNISDDDDSDDDDDDDDDDGSALLESEVQQVTKLMNEEDDEEEVHSSDALVF